MPTPEEIILNSKHVPELPLETSASDTDYDVFYKTSTGKFSRILKSNSKGHITFSPVFLGTVTTSTETTSNSEIVTFINAQGFTISKGELKLLKVNVYIGSLIYTKQYLKIGNEVGTYGNSGTAITFSDLWEIESILVDENSPITTTVDLGDIGSDSVWDYINSTNSVDYELEGDSIYIFSATIDGVDYTYLYVGLQPQDLGDGNNAVDEDDFIQLTPNNENIGESSQRRPSVLSKASIDVAPPTENEGDRYLLYGSGTPNSGWDGQPTNTLVEFNGTSWVAETPKVGQTVYVINTNSNFQYKSSPANGWYDSFDFSEENVKGTSLINLTASGSVDINFNTYSDVYLNLTGATTLSVTAPTLSTGQSVARTMRITGDQTLTHDASFVDVSGTYDGTKDNLYSLVYTKIDSSTLKLFVTIITED